MLWGLGVSRKIIVFYVKWPSEFGVIQCSHKCINTNSFIMSECPCVWLYTGGSRLGAVQVAACDLREQMVLGLDNKHFLFHTHTHRLALEWHLDTVSLSVQVDIESWSQQPKVDWACLMMQTHTHTHTHTHIYNKSSYARLSASV